MEVNKGWYPKYRVTRIDGKEDEEESDYFILKLNSGNPFELDALEAYAKSCEQTLPLLAHDIRERVAAYRKAYKL